MYSKQFIISCSLCERKSVVLAVFFAAFGSDAQWAIPRNRSVFLPWRTSEQTNSYENIMNFTVTRIRIRAWAIASQANLVSTSFGSVDSIECSLNKMNDVTITSSARLTNPQADFIQGQWSALQLKGKQLQSWLLIKYNTFSIVWSCKELNSSASRNFFKLLDSLTKSRFLPIKKLPTLSRRERFTTTGNEGRKRKPSCNMNRRSLNTKNFVFNCISSALRAELHSFVLTFTTSIN